MNVPKTGRRINDLCDFGKHVLLAACCIFRISDSSVTAADDERPVVQELDAANWNALVPQGKEVDAIYGDIVMQNAFL